MLNTQYAKPFLRHVHFLQVVQSKCSNLHVYTCMYCIIKIEKFTLEKQTQTLGYECTLKGISSPIYLYTRDFYVLNHFNKSIPCFFFKNYCHKKYRIIQSSCIPHKNMYLWSPYKAKYVQ